MPVSTYRKPLSERAAFWLMMARAAVLLAVMLYAGFLWVSPSMPHG